MCYLWYVPRFPENDTAGFNRYSFDLSNFARAVILIFDYPWTRSELQFGYSTVVLRVHLLFSKCRGSWINWRASWIQVIVKSCHCSCFYCFYLVDPDHPWLSTSGRENQEQCVWAAASCHQFRWDNQAVVGQARHMHISQVWLVGST
jgi:hypothetical protein